MARFVIAWIGALAAAFVLQIHPTAAEYRLQQSDVLELSIAGVEGLGRRSPVDVDGNVVFPLVGEMHVEGKTVAEVQREFVQRAETKSFDAPTRDGPQAHFIEGDQVTIAIAEYRPIYITGDITKPGEQPFRPGMTVRQAVAVAGGYDILRFRTENPFVQAATLRAEYDELWIDLANAQSTLARLNAELSGQNTFDRSNLHKLPTSDQLVDELADSESEQLTIRLAELEKEKQHLQRLINQAQSRFDLLNQEQAQVQQDRDADARDMDRVRALFEKGIITADRVTDARQSLLTSSLRFLSTAAELGAASESLEGHKRQLEKVDVDHRLAILEQLKQAKIELAKALSGLGAVSEKLLHVGTERSNLVQGLAGSPKIKIFPSTNPNQEGRTARESDMLAPGDLVEVRLEPPTVTAPPGSAARLGTGAPGRGSIDLQSSATAP